VKKTTIIIAVLEAVVLLVMKLMDWKESNNQKPAAGKARRAGGRRVVNPAPQDYNGESPRGDQRAIDILAGSSATDEKVHEED